MDFLLRVSKRNLRPHEEFTAYGQACLEMARGTFQLLDDHRAVLFAVAIPRSIKKPVTAKAEEYLSKDHVFLLERFFYHLEAEQEHGILVMDEVDKTEDRRFVRRMERYFTKTDNGRYRTTWIVPTPFFVASDLTYAVQAADLCIYCVNWGFRLPASGMTRTSRPEIENLFRSVVGTITIPRPGISRWQPCSKPLEFVFVPNPYAPERARIKKGGNAFGATPERVAPGPNLHSNYRLSERKSTERFPAANSEHAIK